MIWLYRLLFPLIVLAMAPHYLWRMRRRGGYAKRFAQRFGAHQVPARSRKARRIWLQAVSVGEIHAVGPVVNALARDGVEIYLTTTTSTGYRLATERYSGRTLGIGYFPLDWWPFSSWAWRRIAPDVAVLMEGERWPEHVRQARIRGVPVININARLSDRTFARLSTWGKRLPSLTRLLLGGVTRTLPCSARDEERFRQLGVDPRSLTTTGNLKLDVPLPPLDQAERARLRKGLGLPEGPILVGASTWPGEEEALLGVLRAVREAGIGCTLLIVPRHAERRFGIEKLLKASGLRFHFRSKGPAPGEVDVAVGDTTGELRKWVQLADLVFVGKSLPPHTEGQTPVEAAAAGKPLLFGPGMSNFADIAKDLLARGAARRVQTPKELEAAAKELLGDPERCRALAAAGAAWRAENGGAAARTVEVIRECLARAGRR